MPRPVKYRDLVKQLKKHDSRFEVDKVKGKGSHRVIYHPDIHGRPEMIPVKYHGANTDLGRGMVKSIIRRFDLPKDLFG